MDDLSLLVKVPIELRSVRRIDLHFYTINVAQGRDINQYDDVGALGCKPGVRDSNMAHFNTKYGRIACIHILQADSVDREPATMQNQRKKVRSGDNSVGVEKLEVVAFDDCHEFGDIFGAWAVPAGNCPHPVGIRAINEQSAPEIPVLSNESVDVKPRLRQADGRPFSSLYFSYRAAGQQQQDGDRWKDSHSKHPGTGAGLVLSLFASRNTSLFQRC